MVKKIIKQIVAIAVAIAFVGSIFLFIPKASNNNQITFYIIVPQALVKNGSLFQSANGSVFIAAPLQAMPVSSIIQGTNATNMLSLTEYLLSTSANITFFNVSGGNIDCINSPFFVQELCYNGSTGAGWQLYESDNGQTLYATSKALSSILLNNIYNTETLFVLQYNSPSGVSNGSGNTPPPPKL